MNGIARLLAIGLLVCHLAPRVGGAEEKPGIERALERGVGFLTGLIDSEARLLPEYRGASVYWLYHDNYLAAKALEDRAPETARIIRSAIADYGFDRSGKIEIVCGEAVDPLPFRQYRLIEVHRIGDKVIKTEIVEGGEFKGWAEYADLLLLAALAESECNPEAGREHLDAALKMWDGIGFNDRAREAMDIYATYKLALAVIAAYRLGAEESIPDGLIERLQAMQNGAGGWITDYKADGTPVGMANVETTSLAMLALEKIGTSD